MCGINQGAWFMRGDILCGFFDQFVKREGILFVVELKSHYQGVQGFLPSRWTIVDPWTWLWTAAIMPSRVGDNRVAIVYGAVFLS